MTPEQMGLLAESWNAVTGRRDEIAQAFYGVLFERHPELRPLFARTDMRAQYEKFAGMIDEIVRLRTEPREFVRSAVLLGQRHAAYGVGRDHYAPAGAALLEALATALGPAFTPAVREAWADGYLLMSSIMCRAAERVPERRAAS
ncbi:MAG: putative hemoprotein [Geminicoccaceae bacterium]|nr:putative hemoprotein [Geminicoccaceae bacterium]